jgi:hypothetical protein
MEIDIDLDQHIIPIRGKSTKDTNKYEFNITWQNSIFFKMNLFIYDSNDDQDFDKMVGLEFIFDDENIAFFDNIIFDKDIRIYDVYLLHADNVIEKDFPYLLNFINNYRRKGIVSRCLESNKELMLKTLKNIESEVYEKFYFQLDSNSSDIYFHRYINFILKRSFNKIFENSKKKPTITPNFLADQKCTTKFRIIIADLLEYQNFWKEKMEEYLSRDIQLDDPRPGIRMVAPPKSHIDENNYFHFIALDAQDNIAGYCICSLSGNNRIRTELGDIKNYFKIFENKEFKKGLKSDNPNIKLFIDYVSSFANNDTPLTSFKSNLFYIESLSTDKAYRGTIEGGSLRIAAFLVYHVLLFAMNAKEFNIGLVGVYSAAEATKAILVKYFGFTENKYLLDERILLNEKNEIENLIEVLNVTNQEIMEKIKNISDDYDFEQYEQGYIDAELNIRENPPYDYLFVDINELRMYELGYKHKELLYFIQKSENEINELYKNTNINYQIFNMYKTSYSVTDCLFIDNPLFHNLMNEYSKRLVDCVVNNEETGSKKRKIRTGEEEEPERKKKKIKTKRHIFSMNQLNKIFI